MSPVRATKILLELGYEIVLEKEDGYRYFKLKNHPKDGFGCAFPDNIEVPDSYIEKARKYALEQSISEIKVLNEEP